MSATILGDAWYILGSLLLVVEFKVMDQQLERSALERSSLGQSGAEIVQVSTDIAVAQEDLCVPVWADRTNAGSADDSVAPAKERGLQLLHMDVVSQPTDLKWTMVRSSVTLLRV